MSVDPRRTSPFCTPRCYRECRCSRWPDYVNRFGNYVVPHDDSDPCADNGLLTALIAYWPGNEAAGNALDAHVNGLDLTDTWTVTSNPGHVYALARQYTRANFEYHTRPGDDALLSAGDVELTLAIWVYMDSKPATDMAIAGKHDALTVAGSEYLLKWEQASDRFAFDAILNPATVTTVWANTFGAPALATWYLLIAWHNPTANTISIQVNGGAVDSAAHNGGMNDSVTPFKIGTASPAAAVGTKWDGRISPTAIWKSAAGAGGVLTATQRTCLWNSGAGLPYTDFT